MSNTMTAEARAALNAYQREWRKNNKDKEREYRARHWEKKAQQLAAEREAAARAVDEKFFTGDAE